MNPKEKAKELVKKFSHKLPYYSEKDNTEKSKQCALICVEEIIDSEPMEDFGCSDSGTEYRSTDEFWQEVKQEIGRYESTNN